MDTLTRAERSKRMSLVKSGGNKSTELVAIQLFRRAGMTGWRRNYGLVGKPDFVFPKQRIAVFIDGCFWHGCTQHRRKPKSNQQYWTNKIERNTCRDKSITKKLREKGWSVVRIWEHELKEENPMRKVKRKLEAQKNQTDW
jgi:DNA mismatch endonuclease (patch repair protein)